MYNNICFISYLTVEPSRISIEEYIQDVNDTVLLNTDSELWLLGRKLNEIEQQTTFSNVKTFENIDFLLKQL